MKSLGLRLPSLLLLVITLSIGAFANSGNLITGTSAGPIKIGMKVSEAMKLMKNHKFTRSSDGEGIVLIDIEKNNKLVFTIYAGEDDVDKPIDKNAFIEQIEVWTSAYKTAAGIGEGSLISVAETKYGKLKEIVMSEIESREYAMFPKTPKGIEFRVQGSGVYPKGARKTQMYRSGAKVSSVLVTGDGTEANVGFFSSYTDLVADCKTPKTENEGSHSMTTCDAPGNYRVHMFDTATTLQIQVRSGNTREFVDLATESLSWSPKGKKIEWRYKNGEPFAAILRVNEYQKGDDGLIKYPVKVLRQYLVVKGMADYSSISGKVDAKQPNANLLARQLADNAYLAKVNAKQSYQVVDTGDYNLKIIMASNKGESWVKSPMGVAWNIAGDFSEMKNRTMSFEAPTGDGFSTFVLTVVSDGLLDDSVRAEKMVFTFLNENGVWKVTSAKRSWKCQPNRGHQDFSGKLCV